MKTHMVQNYSPVTFSGFVKLKKEAIPNITYNNPSKEMLKKVENNMQQEIQKMGLKILKKINLFIKS